jgi:hypothetical protein
LTVRIIFKFTIANPNQTFKVGVKPHIFGDLRGGFYRYGCYRIIIFNSLLRDSVLNYLWLLCLCFRNYTTPVG